MPYQSHKREKKYRRERERLVCNPCAWILGLAILWFGHNLGDPVMHDRFSFSLLDV